MLNSVVDASLRYKVLVLVGFLLIVVFGVRAFRAVPVDAFPDVTPVQVNVYTESPGLAAEDVEKLLTFPVETAMAGLPGRANAATRKIGANARKRAATVMFPPWNLGVRPLCSDRKRRVVRLAKIACRRKPATPRAG